MSFGHILLGLLALLIFGAGVYAIVRKAKSDGLL